MLMDEETWHLVSGVDRVASFLGSKSRPSPVSENQVTKILGQLEEVQDREENLVTFTVGENVQVIGGPFASFSGLVERVVPEKEAS